MGLLLAIMMLIVPVTAAAAAQDIVRLTASAEYDGASHAVRVSGNLSSGKGQWIAAQLLNADMNPVYFDQIAAGERGDFALSIYIPEQRSGGKYELRLGAAGLEAVTKLAFTTVKTPEPEGPEEPQEPGQPPVTAPGQNTGSTGGQTQTTDKEIILHAKSVKETNGNGQSAAVVQLTKQQLSALLPTASHSILIVESDSTEAVQELRISLEVLEQYYESEALDKVVFRNNGAAYELPLQELFLTASRTDPDAQVTIQVERLLEPVADKVIASLMQSGSRSLSAPIAFKLSILTGTALQEIKDFRGYSVKRIYLDQTVDTAKSVAVLYDPVTGSIRPVPTVMEYENGAWTAAIKHSGNGMYAVVRNDRHFADVKGHWSQADVVLLANRFIINGVSESAFHPDGEVTRAEFAAMLVRALGLDASGQTARFTDVKASDWHAGAVLAAVQAGIVDGYEKGQFGPDRYISRQEMTVMLQRAAQYGGIAPIAELSAYEQATSGFHDSNLTSSWAEQAMTEAIGRGWLQGRSSTQLAPEGTTTRAEAAVMLKRMLIDLTFINS